MSRHVFLVSVLLIFLLFVGRIYTNHTYVSSFLKFGHITGRIFTTSQSLFMSTDGVFGSPDRSVGIFMSYSTGPLTISLDSCGLMIHCLLYLDWFYIRMEGAMNGPLTFFLLAKFDLCSICSQNFNEYSLARASQIFPVAHMLTFLSVLPNFIPRGGLALPDFPGLFIKSSFKMADSRSKNSNERILFRRNIDQYSLGESV